MKAFVLAVWSLLAREWLRFLRQRNRLVGALATPILLWAFFGSGFGSSFQPPGLGAGMAYTAYFFPGTLLLVVLFTAIFSSISVIEDRNEGFLQGVMVSPVPRLAIVLGKVLGSATLGAAQGVLVLALAPLAGLSLNLGQALQAAAIIFLVAFAMSGLGFYFAWRMDSVQGFHAVMNLVLMPMWFLSGALFPASGAAGWIGLLMAANPLAYGLSALRWVLYPVEVAQGLGDTPLATSLAVIGAMALGVLLLSVAAARRPVILK